MTRDVTQRITRYVATEAPDSALEVIAQLAQYGVGPEHEEYIEAVLAGEDVSHAADPPPTTDTPGAVEVSPDREAPGAPIKKHDESGADGPTHPDNSKDTETSATGWNRAAFDAPKPGVWPDERLQREQWMGHVEKKPFAPWADRDHPDADADEDARWKWGLTENYVDGETVAMAEVDPRLDGRAFLQQPDDPFAYVDGDDVRDPATGDVHPGFVAILERLGLTYADVSQSGAGSHALYRGDLPEGVKQTSWQLDDEPWGANDEPPTVEIYAGKRVCVDTGRHVPGTPVETRPWDEDALEALLEEHDQLPTERTGVAEAREEFDATNYDPVATTSEETTSDIRDCFAALDRLDARDVADRTIVHRWNDDASTSDGKRAFVPTWGRSANGTANVVDDQIWQDTGGGGYGGPVVMALIDRGDMRPRSASPRDATGAEWFRGYERLRELGFNLPEHAPDEEEDAEPLTAIPFDILDALNPEEARRFARKHGIEWPSTDDARQRLEERLFTALRHQEDVVVDAPTALGKSHTVATMPWLAHADATGEQPVVQLSETREARDQSAAASAAASGVTHAKLLGRKEACPVAAGGHDPVNDEDDECAPDVEVTIGGTPASEWFDAVCDRRGVAFSVAHSYLTERNDQGLPHLPCCGPPDADPDAVGECRAVTQWDGLPRTEDGESAVDVIHATHQFAHVPSLLRKTNLVFDEQPDFTQELTTDRIQRAVAAYLKTIDAPVRTWEAFVQLARAGGSGVHGDVAAERDATKNALDETPGRDWYLEERDAHTLAPALAKAVWYALADDVDENGRRAATVPHEPPRLDAGATDDEGWNREWLTVVLDDDNRVQTVRAAPDLSLTRAVVGLDAHPAAPLWQRNTKPCIQVDAVLDPDERRLWRRFERGLVVVQVGDATRPLTSGEYFDEDGTRAVLEGLHEHYGARFGTAITAASVEGETRRLMRDVGVSDLATMHYNEEKSRNDFAGEDVGFLNGCIDPGDDYVIDLLAECGLDATPERTEDGDRVHGRGFDGPDAETAAALLASVRENHVAQGAGRYARDADDPTNRAVVYVRTDAMPPGFADLQVPGVEWVATDAQRAILDALQDHPNATAKELAEHADVSRRHANETLRRYAERGVVGARDGAGDYGATLYRLLADEAPSGFVDLGGDGSGTTPYEVSSTWSFQITRATTPPSTVAWSRPRSRPRRDETQRGLAAFDGGDRPPDDAT